VRCDTLNLRNRMILYISVPVIIVLIALSMFTYFQASAALDRQIRRTAAFQAENYSNDIQKRLAAKEAIVSVLAKEMLPIWAVRPLRQAMLASRR